MSWPALKWALLKRLPAPQKSTLVTLARRDPELHLLCLDTIADESGLSRSGVKLALASLQRAGLVSVKTQIKRGNTYTLILTSASHDVTGYDMTSHDVTAEESRDDRPTSHDVTTNREKYKEVSTKRPTRAKRESDPGSSWKEGGFIFTTRIGTPLQPEMVTREFSDAVSFS